VTKDIQKEELIKEDSLKEELVKEELHKEEEDVFGQYLYKFICSTCHELPDTDDYDYTPEEWSDITDSMYDTMEHRKSITLKEIEKIKCYLKKELIKEDSFKVVLVKEELHKEEEDVFGQYLYKFICSTCHALPVTDDYGYTPEEWSDITDSMYDTMEHRKSITLKEVEKIKDYLENTSQKR
jgi:cytochrome c5